jgi:hypothetical protein
VSPLIGEFLVLVLPIIQIKIYVLNLKTFKTQIPIEYFTFFLCIIFVHASLLLANFLSPSLLFPRFYSSIVRQTTVTEPLKVFLSFGSYTYLSTRCTNNIHETERIERNGTKLKKLTNK